MEEKPNIALPHSRIQCFIDGLTRTEFLELYKLSGYGAESSLVQGSYPEGSLINNRDFANENDFVNEHERVERLAKTISSTATVRSFYYPANDENSLYRRAS
jgi:hypothetical protein